MQAIAPADRVSLLTGEPFVAREPPERYRRPALLLAATAHLGLLVLLALSLGRIPQVPEGPVGFEPLTLVFAVEAGPGGGGGGGGEASKEPPSVRKAEGHDVAKVAVETEKKEPLHFEPTPPVAASLEVPASEKTDEIIAPVVSSTPDDVSQKGVLEGTESLVESAGPGTGGGAGTGTGTGVGPGEGPGIGPGRGGGFGGGAYHIGSGVEPPVLRHRVQPAYTNEALRAKLEGSVTLEIVILRDGTVGPVRVTESLDPGLDRNAIESVRQWRFVPGKFRGQAVDVIAEVVVQFRLL